MKAEKKHIRLLVVDDHDIVRMGLRSVLGRDPEIQIVGEAGTSAQAVAEVVRLRPDLILLDVRLPDGSGIGICRTILELSPETRILFLTSFLDEEAELAAMVEGACGYMLKEDGAEKLIRSIKAVADGQSVWTR